MAPKGAHVGVIASVLGYCILPIVILSVINILIDLKGIVGTFASVAAVLWWAYFNPKMTLDLVDLTLFDRDQNLTRYLGVQYQHLGYSQMV